MRSEHPYGRARATPHIASGGQGTVETGTGSLTIGLSRTLTRTLPPQRNAQVENQSKFAPSREGGQIEGPSTPLRHLNDLPQRSPACRTSMSPSVVHGRMKTLVATSVRQQEEVVFPCCIDGM